MTDKPIDPLFLLREYHRAVWHGDGARKSDLEAIIDALEAERADAMKARVKLWIGHGHLGVYGDDGELQCVECGAGKWDFRRSSLEAVAVTALAALYAKLEAERAKGKKVAAEMRDFVDKADWEAIPRPMNDWIEVLDSEGK